MSFLPNFIFSYPISSRVNWGDTIRYCTERLGSHADRSSYFISEEETEIQFHLGA